MRVRASLPWLVLLVSTPALALDAGDDGGEPSDASADADLDAASADAAWADAAADADASADASAPKSDASGACCPELPCTCPADASPPDDDGGSDAGLPAGGCTCESAPGPSGGAWAFGLLAAVAVAATTRRRTRR